MTTPTFNLWTDPWISVERHNGEIDHLNLGDTLQQAQHYQALYDPSPLVVVGIHRLLVAILQDALTPQQGEDLADLWDASQFPADKLAAFAQTYVHRFDLFSETEPFMQSADLPLSPPKKAKPNPQSVAVLFLEIPTGTGISHYQHGIAAQVQLCPVDVAKGLVMIPPFASSGGAGIKPSLNGVPPMYVIPGGETLFASLWASLTTPAFQPAPSREVVDTPWWRHSPVVGYKQEVDQVGYLHSLTFPARRIRLHPQPMSVACSRCGQRHAWGVQSMVYQMGESRAKTAPFWFDPFAAYRLPGEKSKKDEQPKPIRPVVGRVLWREFSTLFLPSQGKAQPSVLQQVAKVIDRFDLADDQTPYPFQVVGLRTDMKAKIFEWTEVGFRVAPAMLQDPHVGHTVDEALEFALTGAKIIKQVFRHSFGGAGKDERHQRSKMNMVQHYWTTLTLPFNDFIAALSISEQRDELSAAWLDRVMSTAETVFREAAETLGHDGLTLRQRVEGENFCRARLRKAKNQYKSTS